MAKKIIGVVAGYIAMAAFVFISFTVLYLILGAEGSFQPGNYIVSTTWKILSIVLSFLAAITGGIVCNLISKDKKTAYWLAGIVFVLGIILAIPQLGSAEAEKNKLRSGNVDNIEAMQNAKQPDFMLLLNPLLGAIGVIAGAGMKKQNAG